MIRKVFGWILTLPLIASSATSGLAQEGATPGALKRYGEQVAIFKLEPGVQQQAYAVLNRFKTIFTDPRGGVEGFKRLKELEPLGKDLLPAGLNFLTTEIDHDSREGMWVASLLYTYLRRKAREWWAFKSRTTFGVFESSVEKWKAVREMKTLCTKQGWEVDEAKTAMEVAKLADATFSLDAHVARTADEALKAFKKHFGDPQAEQEALKNLTPLGKACVPAVLNFFTREIDFQGEEGAMMGSQLFAFLKDRVYTFWRYEPEYHFGMFESLREKRNALLEIKALCLEKGAWTLARKKMEAPIRDFRSEAQAHFAGGRYEEAWQAYEAALKQTPSDPDLLNDYAWNLVTFPKKNLATAKRALPFAKRAVELAPRNAAILDTLAEVYFVLGETKMSLEWNRKCLEFSSMFTYYNQLAKYAGRYVRELEARKAPKPEQAEAHAWLAEGLLGKRPPDASKAETHARIALALHPVQPSALRHLARSLFHQKKYPEAAVAFETALGAAGAGRDARLHFGLGLALLESEGGNPQKSAHHLRAALALDPGLAGGRRALSRAYLAMEDPDAALAEAQLAASRIRDRWQPERHREPLLILMGKAWELKGKPAWALEFFLQAVLQRGNDPEGEKGLERAYRAAFLEGPPKREYFAERNRVETTFFDAIQLRLGLQDARGRRIAVGDANGDGLPDLLLGGCRLWIHRGKTFENATEASGLAGAGGRGGLFADVDNDGDLDLFLAGSGKGPKPGDALLLNDGKGRFLRVQAAGVSDEHPTEGAAFGDYDGDGFVDLYVANYEGPMSIGHPDFLYKGRGDGTFVDVSEKAGIERNHHRCGRGVNWGDFDNDGDLDIHVSNYRLQPNFLLQNRGDGTFADVAEEKGVKGVQIRGYFGHTIGSDFGDIDNDGDLDLFQANLAHPRFIEFSDQSFLLINGGAPHFMFRDDRRRRGIRFEETHSDPVFADFDNDGFLDLYITSVYRGRKSFLYRNRGDGSFADVTWYAGVRVDNGWGCAVTDIDRDGDLDLLVCGSDGLQIFRNRGNDHAWLTVRVIGGPKSNRSGIGARVILRTRAGGFQMREIQGGRGTTSQDEMCAHFGLGAHPGPVTVIVRFPANPPITRTYENVEPNRILVARESD
ncbi:MAG: CRTAC1 family protein [Planctomycetota bacterium]|jgi:tetratricopeptide (TPR) repeat protein